LEFSRSTTYSPEGRGSFRLTFRSVADTSVTSIGIEVAERFFFRAYANWRVPLATWRRDSSTFPPSANTRRTGGFEAIRVGEESPVKE